MSNTPTKDARRVAQIVRHTEKVLIAIDALGKLRNVTLDEALAIEAAIDSGLRTVLSTLARQREPRDTFTLSWVGEDVK